MSEQTNAGTQETIGERLQAALTPLYGENVFPDVFVGLAEEYVVYNYSTIPEVYAERAPRAARYLIQVHLYSPREKNPTAAIQALDRALWDAGFTWPSVTDASDAEGQHHVLQCEGCDGGGYYGFV